MQELYHYGSLAKSGASAGSRIMYSNLEGSQLENNLVKSLYNNKWMESNAALIKNMYGKYRPSREELDAYAKLSSDLFKRYGMTEIASANMEDESYVINKLGSNLKKR